MVVNLDSRHNEEACEDILGLCLYLKKKEHLDHLHIINRLMQIDFLYLNLPSYLNISLNRFKKNKFL